jgi:hypothetical protein
MPYKSNSLPNEDTRFGNIIRIEARPHFQGVFEGAGDELLIEANGKE